MGIPLDAFQGGGVSVRLFKDDPGQAPAVQTALTGNAEFPRIIVSYTSDKFKRYHQITSLLLTEKYNPKVIAATYATYTAREMKKFP